METLRSLLFITEAEVPAKGPVALEDLANFFPSKHSQAIKLLWGSDRLTYMGKPFHHDADESGHGPVYKGIHDAAQKALDEATVNINIDLSAMPVARGSHDHNDDLPEFDADIKISAEDSQEVYLGYQPSTNHIFIGYDAWLDDEDKNQHIDDFMDKMDDPAHVSKRDQAEAYLGEELQEHDFVGVLIELATTDGAQFTVVDTTIEPRGFYKGIHRSTHGSFNTLKLIDLHLD